MSSGAPGIAVRALTVTELLAGTSLRHRVALAHLPHRRLARAASQVADALARLHAVGLVHGAVTADAIALQSDDGAGEGAPTRATLTPLIEHMPPTTSGH